MSLAAIMFFLQKLSEASKSTELALTNLHSGGLEVTCSKTKSAELCLHALLRTPRSVECRQRSLTYSHKRSTPVPSDCLDHLENVEASPTRIIERVDRHVASSGNPGQGGGNESDNTGSKFTKEERLVYGLGWLPEDGRIRISCLACLLEQAGGKHRRAVIWIVVVVRVAS
ncbi:hypothetical protein IWZ00DRAFT_276542 [Phyllosticta capitalensis]